MKYALLIAAAALFAGPALAHETTCVPPGTMVAQNIDGSLILVDKHSRAVLADPFYPTPNCKPLIDRNGVAYGSTGQVESSLMGDTTLTRIEPVTPVMVVPEPPRLVTPPVTVTNLVPANGSSVTNNYYGNVYYGNNGSWWNGWSTSDDSYYTPPFTLADLRARCPSLDMAWAARALPYYSSNYSFFQLWRMEINWNGQHDYEEACQIFASPDKPIPTY